MKKETEQPKIEPGVLCPVCGRGYQPEDGVIPEHKVRKLTTRAVVICKGSGKGAQ